ncbi:MAG: hypothetical protein O2782_20250 [bacterium]|nr:hypothetical protein [bacterium]
MNRAAKNVLRKLGTDIDLDEERQQLTAEEAEEAQQRQLANEAQRTAERNREAGISSIPEEMRSESEKRHDQYRRRQAMDGRSPSAAERLPIMTAAQRKARDKDRPKYHATEFEGPIEKLIEKYPDMAEVQRHLTLGQSMKYEFTDDGRVLDREGTLIFDGERIVSSKK